MSIALQAKVEALEARVAALEVLLDAPERIALQESVTAIMDSKQKPKPLSLPRG